MPSSLKKFLSHEAGPVAQFIKYAIAGGMATAINILGFYICGWVLFPCLTPDDPVVRLLKAVFDVSIAAAPESGRALNAFFCNGIAFFVSNAFCYIANRLLVFKPGRHHWIIEALLFFAVSALSSIVVGSSIQTWLIHSFGIETTYAFSANILSSLAINYVMRRFIIFKG